MSLPAGNLTQPIFQTTPTRAGGRELGNQNISSLFGQQPNLSQQPGGLADLVNFAPRLTPQEADAVRSRFKPQNIAQNTAGTSQMFPEEFLDLTPQNRDFSIDQFFRNNPFG